jgi:argininosuccinate lyase
MAQVLWSGRLEAKPEAEALSFESSITVDSRLAREDIAGSRAHVAMLAKQGIIPAEAAKAIDEELGRISAELAEGTLQIDMEAEDIHSFIEAVLTERLGDVGRMVHAGRSRNDQVAVDLRLYLKRVVPEIAEEIRATCQVLLELAEQHLETLMPGYTHLQRAQPVSLAHHLTAWTAGLVRDRQRFLDALTRLDECPLGSGALATSTLHLDREAVARSLGFPGPTVNSMDSVADRDFALELAGACAILATHLSRFCEDIIIWATEEFGFIDLAEQWSTGSSIMPQKKNPDFAELIRGKAGRQIGNLVSLLTLLKGLPYAYDRDLQEDKEALFDVLDTARATLRMFRPMMATARFRQDRMEAACVGGFLEATDVAEYLVRKGLPFRKAHEVAAQIVRDCGAAGQRSIAERSLDQLRSRCELFDADLYEVIRPAAALHNRSRSGGPAPQAVQNQIAELRNRLNL